MKFLVFILILCAVGFIVYKFVGKKIVANLSDAQSSPVGAISSSASLPKKGFRMMTYQEALEASKQFIYNITKAVMQRFTPDSQQYLLDLGKKLVKNGVTYLHVVDVAALSAEKEKQLSHLQKEQPSSIGVGKK